MLNIDLINEDFNLEIVENENTVISELLVESKPVNQEEMKEHEKKTSIFLREEDHLIKFREEVSKVPR